MKPQDPKNLEELQRMLNAGMGRAILFLMKQDFTHYRDLILDSCLHNHAYDQQVEQTRAEYLFPLIKVSGDKDYYRDEILKAIPETVDSHDTEQLLDFAVLFARKGDEEAGQAIYEKLKRNDTDSSLTGEDQVIELDGVKGLIFLLEFVGSDPELISCWYEHDSIIEKTEKISGVSKVRNALKKAALSNPAVADVLAHMNYDPNWTVKEIVRRREERRFGHWQLLESLSAETTWEELKNNPNFHRLAFHWARNASDAELKKAAEDLDPNEEPERLRYHLRVFDRRPFPLDPEPLIRLVDHPNERVAISALSALELVKHPKVRSLFDRLIEDLKWQDRAPGLLRSNYQSGDDRILLDLLQKESDPERLHMMCINIMDVYEDNPLEEGMQPLILVYEKDPCSTCRCTCVKTIQNIQNLPEWMIEECLYDVRSETREFAAELKQSTPPHQ